MVESYSVGDKLLPEDFSSAYYMPQGAYQYCEVLDITDDKVQLSYVDVVGSTESTMWVTKNQMERMLGWEDDPLIGADDAQLEELGLLDVVIGDDMPEQPSDEEILNTIQTAPTEDDGGEFELLNTDGEKFSMFIQKRDERAIKAFIFSDKESCRIAYKVRSELK